MAKVVKVAEGVYMLSGIVSRQYLVTGEGSAILIDAGLPGNGKAVLRALAELEIAPTELQHILITHADADHYGGVNEIRAATGARVYASKPEADAMAAGRSSRLLTPKGFERLFYGLLSPIIRAQPTPVDCVVSEGDHIGNLIAVASPGHTPGHISFFLEERSVLLAGDSIQVIGGQPASSSGGNTWDADLARHMYRKQMELLAGSGHVCCGHGYCHIARSEGE